MSAVKANFILEDKVKEELESLVPSGKRSKVVNEALKKELLRIKRKKLTERLLLLRSQAPKVPIEEILRTLKDNRRKH